jgi:hypothetical protein
MNRGTTVDNETTTTKRATERGATHNSPHDKTTPHTVQNHKARTRRHR